MIENESNNPSPIEEVKTASEIAEENSAARFIQSRFRSKHSSPSPTLSDKASSHSTASVRLQSPTPEIEAKPSSSGLHSPPIPPPFPAPESPRSEAPTPTRPPTSSPCAEDPLATALEASAKAQSAVFSALVSTFGVSEAQQMARAIHKSSPQHSPKVRRDYEDFNASRYTSPTYEHRSILNRPPPAASPREIPSRTSISQAVETLTNLLDRISTSNNQMMAPKETRPASRVVYSPRNQGDINNYTTSPRYGQADRFSPRSRVSASLDNSTRMSVKTDADYTDIEVRRAHSPTRVHSPARLDRDYPSSWNIDVFRSPIKSPMSTSPKRTPIGSTDNYRRSISPSRVMVLSPAAAAAAALLASPRVVNRCQKPTTYVSPHSTRVDVDVQRPYSGYGSPSKTRIVFN